MTHVKTYISGLKMECSSHYKIHETLFKVGIQSSLSTGSTIEDPSRCNSQFFPQSVFPRGKNGPAHSFPGEKTDWGKNWPEFPPSQFFPRHN